MMNFNKSKIRTKILFLVSVFTIFLIGFGVFSYNATQQLSKLSNTIYEHPLTVSNASQSASAGIVRMHRSMKDVVLANNSVELALAIAAVNEYESEVLSDLEVIDLYILGDDGKELAHETIQLFIDWRPIRQSVIDYVQEGDYESASEITKTIGADHVSLLELKFEELKNYAFDKADGFVDEAIELEQNTMDFTLILTISGVFISFIVSGLLMSSITKAFKELGRQMDEIASGGVLTPISFEGSEEVLDLTISFNKLVKTISNQIWVKDNIKVINDAFDYQENFGETLDSLSSLIADGIDVESVLIYKKNEDNLLLRGSHAFSERYSNLLSVKATDGVLGQVLKTGKHVRVQRNDSHKLVTANDEVIFEDTLIAPIQTKEGVVGVIEVDSITELSDFKEDYILEVAKELAIFFNVSDQNEKITNLLIEANDANQKVSVQAEELQKSNVELEEKQSELEQQQNELMQQASVQKQLNSELQERQQQLQMQTEEIKQKNDELELIKDDLLSSNEMLTVTNKYKTDFLTNMSHELRTPLNSIILLSSILSKNGSSNLHVNDIRQAEIINKAGNELLALINDLLDLSKIESGKTEVNVGRVQFDMVLNRLEDMFVSLTDEKGIQFSTETTVKDIISDEDKINHILVNLVSNAIKFTSKGEVTVKISENEDKDYPVKVEVRDSGIGITEDKLEFIFEEFRQANSNISTNYGGTGLGLAICKGLTELIDGKITVSSVEGEGSVFTLVLPLSIETQSNDEVVINERPRLIDDSDSIREDDQVILAIEDDYEFVEKIKPFINERGYKLLHAADGRTGLEIAMSTKVEAVMLDLLLPDISGEEVLHRLKNNVSTRSLPIYILSGKEMGTDHHLLSAGAKDYISKSDNPQKDVNILIDSFVKNTNNNKSILLVEDSEAEQIAINHLLSGNDYEIDIVSDIASAENLINKNEYGAIIVDLVLGDESGLDLCKSLKGKNLKMPIILYTAKDLSAKESREFSRYSDSIILKTVNSHGRLLEELSVFISDIAPKNEYWEKFEFEGKRVLICDDDVKNIFSLSAALESIGVEVKDAFNGQEALDILSNDLDFDLILMDIMMPVMDGIEAINRIKENELTKDIPVIAVTAKAMKGDKESFIEAGASDYISKPIDFEILRKLLTIWIR